MPIYPYKCKHCGKEFETEHKASEQPKYNCPFCGEDTLERQIGTTSFHLAGGGWGNTGYK